MDNNYDQCKCFIIRRLLVHLFFPLFRSNDRKKKTPEIMIFLCRYVIDLNGRVQNSALSITVNSMSCACICF